MGPKPARSPPPQGQLPAHCQPGQLMWTAGEAGFCVGHRSSPRHCPLPRFLHHRLCAGRQALSVLSCFEARPPSLPVAVVLFTIAPGRLPCSSGCCLCSSRLSSAQFYTGSFGNSVNTTQS
uniref:Uncharacterized protein n=1 Tax=Pipistrellus kuhlii TaxID=59472 RepID=A0A7J7T2B0_PIPKU|nr:hypothetical protein mPipKuh1_009703 [Pipistrellus kuhlii]